MKRYGLVFKINDQCWLSEYVDGEVETASPIDDDEGVYTDLNPREISLVEIVNDGETEGGERVNLQDIKSIAVENEEFPEKTIHDLILDGDFPEIAKKIFDRDKL